MTKADAIKLFNGVNNMAEALGVTRQTIHGWNANLTLGQTDRVRGAFMRIKSDPDEAAKAILDKSFVRHYTGQPVKVK